MSAPWPSPRARVRALEGHERRIRERARRRAIAPLVQPADHQYKTPIPARYMPGASLDHMMAPGSIDDTGFSDGIV
jgi:hypothetical protein